MKIKLLAGFLLFTGILYGQQNPIQIDANGLTQTLASGGIVSRGQIVKINSAGQVVPMATTDTSGAIGVAATSQQNQGQSISVSIAGVPLIQVDGTCAAGNLISISSTTAGFGHCASSAAGQQIGVALSASSPGSTFWNIQLAPLTAGSTIGPSSAVPTVFNVKTNGAKGDTQMSAGNCTLSNGSANLSCTGITFTAADVGKRANCGLQIGAGLFFTAGSTISSLVNSTTVALSSTSNGTTSSASCAWGTQDDTAINTTVTAFLAAIRAGTGQGPKFSGAIPANPPVLYFPTGGYLYCGTTNSSMVNLPASAGGASIIGDAPHESWLVACDNAATSSLGFFINQGSGGNQLVIKNLAFTSALMGVNPGSPLVLNGTHLTENLYITYWNGGGGAFTSTGNGYNLNLVVDNSAGTFQQGAINCVTCSDEFHYGGSSNNGGTSGTPGYFVSGAFGLNTATGPRFFNVINDECGNLTTGCFVVKNSSDVWIIGSSLFSTTSGQALNVDGNSFVHLTDGIIGVFGTDSNATGLKVQAGGVVQSQDVRYVGTGTGNPINNSGIFNDNGGNTNESQFPIASGTSTGTTAVLTLTNVGAAVNTNCAVGDALMVQNAAIAGYDGYYPAGATSGITAVTATTLTYTTAGSNLGALGAGGTAYCRNLLTYTGTLPKALLNNPIPNTCYITGTFAATTAAAPMCAFKLGSATNINFIKATSTTTTACTVAPVVTISDGTVSETLTITTAKSIWDSSVDASTGVGTSIFKPNGTITLSNTVGTCTTPPTNFGVSYNISPILSN